MHTCWRVPSDKRRIVIPPVSGAFKVVGEFSKENPREYMLDLSSNVSAGEAGGEHTTKCVWLPWDPLGGLQPRPESNQVYARFSGARQLPKGCSFYSLGYCLWKVPF